MVAPTYFRTLAPNSDNNTIDNQGFQNDSE